MSTPISTMATGGKTNGSGIAENLRHLVDEADHLLQSAVEGGDDRAAALRVKVAHHVDGLRAQLEDIEDRASYKVRRAARATDRAVHSHPYQAAGIAAAVGLLVGFLAARR